MLQRGIARVGLVASRACFGLDGGVLGVSCGFALRATVAAFVVLGAVLEKLAVLSLWMVIRAYGMGMWTLRALVALLDWVGATY